MVWFEFAGGDQMLLCSLSRKLRTNCLGICHGVEKWRGFLVNLLQWSLFPRLSGPMRDTTPYRAIHFRDSIAEGVSHAF